MDNSFYVYAWSRPDTGEVFYIGKGRGARDVDLWRRGQHFYRVVEKLKRNGLSPTVVRVAEGLSEKDAFELERAEIRRIGRKDLGLGPLVNKTDGGEGSSGYFPSQESRDKLSASLRKLYEDDPTQRMKRSAANLKRYEDHSEREKSSTQQRMAYARDPSRGPAHSEALLDFYRDPAARQKISEGNLRRFEDPEERRKVSLRMRMSPPSKRNTSGLKGVAKAPDSGNWIAKLKTGDALLNLGTYPTKELAGLAYDRAAIKAWPDGCYLNFPDRINEVLSAEPLAQAGPMATLRRNNSSGFKGVSYSKPKGKWSAYIAIKRQRRHIGYFDTAVDAALAYDAAAYAAWGSECYLNFPDRVGEVEPVKFDDDAGRMKGPRPGSKHGYKGISFFKRTGRWIAQISVDKKSRGLGYYDTAEQAARAYDAAAYEAWGDDCYLNFPEEIERFKSAA